MSRHSFSLVLFLCEKMKDYKEFLIGKSHLSGNYGFDPIYMPDYLFDFQKHVITKGLVKGRTAFFADTGLGKTAIELVCGQNVLQKENKPVLILTPIAVAFQFLIEAEKIGIDSIEYSKDGKYTKDLVITNYYLFLYFDPYDFRSVIIDESSILKNFDGAIKGHITSFIKKVKYRFLGTATPSPNDFIELGTSSEALGYLGYTDMLGMFFKNNEDTISPMNIGVQWILKSHAKNNFWKWVSSWSMSIRKPSDLGFSDDGYILPDLIIKDHKVQNDTPLVVNGQTSMFTVQAKNFREIRAENRQTIEKRCNKAFELASKHDTSVYWCNLNDEADIIQSLDKDSYQIKGPMSFDQKEEMLIAFSKGEIKKLITKPKMTAFGLNWQHCNHTTFFPTYSYEQYYQALRRFWRFGQKREVYVDLVLSDGQEKILNALKEKTRKANEMFDQLNKHLNSSMDIDIKEFDKKLTIPKFL